MLLSLKAITYKERQPDQAIAMDFDRQGGGIGRLPAPANRLHLPDPDKYISRKHARIAFDNDAFLLTDTSTAGTFCINKNQLVHNETIQLEDGDHLRIGEYELIVTLSETTDSSPSPPLPDLEEIEDPPVFGSDTEPAKTTHWPGDNASGAAPLIWPECSVECESFTPPEAAEQYTPHEIPPDFDINQLLGNDEEARQQTPVHGIANEGRSGSPISESWPHPSSDKAEVPKPPPAPGGSGNPTSLRQAIQKASQPSQETKHPIQAAQPQPLLDLFLAAAGLTGDDIATGVCAEEVACTLGALFKALVDGLMATLKARSELKSQFRVSMTVLKPVENNPLKFSTHSEEALKHLLKKGDTAFLDPVEAVREGFEDVGNHQLALAAGIQSSLMSLLKKFDPIHFEKRFNRGLPINKNAKCWNAYKETYDDMVKEALDDIFGADFSQAYDQQIQALKSSRKRTV